MKTSFKRGITLSESKGFTLIELLVVIAIIGILSAVVLTSLNSARAKGRIGAAQSTMKSVQTAAQLCINDATPVAPNLPTETINGGGGVICAGNGSYSSLPTGWLYCDGTAATGCATASTASATAFSISATGDSKTITCNESSCTTP